MANLKRKIAWIKRLLFPKTIVKLPVNDFHVCVFIRDGQFTQTWKNISMLFPHFHTDKLCNVLTSQLTLIMYFGAFYIKELRTEVKREVLLV